AVVSAIGAFQKTRTGGILLVEERRGTRGEAGLGRIHAWISAAEALLGSRVVGRRFAVWPCEDSVNTGGLPPALILVALVNQVFRSESVGRIRSGSGWDAAPDPLGRRARDPARESSPTRSSRALHPRMAPVEWLAGGHGHASAPRAV